MDVLNRLPRQARRSGKQRELKRIATFPTLFSLGNLLCGFAAVYFCMREMLAAGEGVDPASVQTLGRFLLERLWPSFLAMGGYLIFLAMIFDALDGRLARLTRRTSDFGGQLDSLADVVSFGVAPALLVVALLTRQLRGEWVVAPFGDVFGRAAWVMAGLYVACAALRLARFNVESSSAEEAHMSFRGLPSPGAGGALASLVILHEWIFRQEVSHGTWASQVVVKSMPLAALLLGLLMVSSFRYVHVVNAYLRGRRSFGRVVCVVIALGVAFWRPEVTLALVVCGYAVSGPAAALIRRWRPPSKPPPQLVHSIHETPTN